jgi:hypothetical protein
MKTDVAFPLKVTFENGEVESYESIEDLERNLEDFDSDLDAECSITDKYGRSVYLKLKLLEVKEISLLD